MAKLCNQKWVVKRLYNFYRETGYSRDNDTYNYRLRNINQGGVPEQDFLGSLQIHMTLRDWITSRLRSKYFKSPNYQLDRMHKIERLYQTCVDDGFIEPVKEKVYDKMNNVYVSVTRGLKVTNLGTDLINFVGFTEIALKKYPTLKLIMTTIIATLLSTTVLGAIILHMIR